jgi:hypothetical protein
MTTPSLGGPELAAEQMGVVAAQPVAAAALHMICTILRGQTRNFSKSGFVGKNALNSETFLVLIRSDLHLFGLVVSGIIFPNPGSGVRIRYQIHL